MPLTPIVKELELSTLCIAVFWHSSESYEHLHQPLSQIILCIQCETDRIWFLARVQITLKVAMSLIKELHFFKAVFLFLSHWQLCISLARLQIYSYPSHSVLQWWCETFKHFFIPFTCVYWRVPSIQQFSASWPNSTRHLVFHMMVTTLCHSSIVRGLTNRFTPKTSNSWHSLGMHLAHCWSVCRILG